MVKNNIDALRSVYLSLGGSLDDTYEDINGGSPVSAYRSVKDHIAAISKLDVGSGSGLPDVTAEDNGKIVRVSNGEWTKSGTKIDTSAPASDFTDMLYLVSYESDSNQIRLTYSGNRVYNFSTIPVTLKNETNSLVQQNVLGIVQSKKWHVLETRITADDEMRNFIPKLYSPFVLYRGQTPMYITYANSTKQYFEGWAYSDQISGFLHSYANYDYESSNDEAVITIFVRYEESV